MKGLIYIKWKVGSLAIALMILHAASCKKFVSLCIPDSRLITEAVYRDPTSATAAMVNIYGELRTNNYLNAVWLGLYVDELDGYSTVATNPFYENKVLPSESTLSTVWNTCYNWIYAANGVYEGVSQSTALNDAVKKQLGGEALFSRAMFHLYLANLFGSVPYITTTDYLSNRAVTKITYNQTLDSVINDLKKAVALLPDAYATAERGRPNKGAAMALLARTYLYAKQWANAEKAASYVIDSTNLYQWVNNLDDEYLRTSTGTIWQFIPLSKTSPTEEGNRYIFQITPSSYALKDVMVNSLEPGDLRKNKWIAAVVNGAQTWYHVYKYKKSIVNDAAEQEYSIILRLAEQYLIRAEARIEQDKFSEGHKDLNKIRTRAGLPDVTTNDKAALRDIILKERRIELLTEYGHRFFDLRRFGKLDAALSPVKPNWRTHFSVLPLPENELSLNPDLKPQNKDY